MTTAYTTLLGLALPVTGELSGTWGDTVNDYITQYLDASVAGTQTISGSQTAVTLSKTTNASLSQAGSGATGSSQYNIINCTGNPASMLTVTVPAASKTYVVVNATSTNQDVKIVGAGPTTGVTLVAGEKAVIAWNGSDFIKVATSTADGVTTLSFGSTGLTPSTATSGAVTVAGTLVAANGGTGQSSYTTGDLLYATGSTALSKLGIGTNGQILTSTGTAPQWSTLSGVAVTTFSAGTTGFTPSSATSGAVTLAGTLATTNGGTGLTSFTANRVFYASSTSAVGQSASLTFDGTTLTAANFTDSSLTSGRVTYATTGGNLTDSANLLYSGTDLTVYGITVGRGAGAVASNTAVGASALAANTSGAFNVAVGANAAVNATSFANATVVGMNAIGTGVATGTYITAIGTSSLQKLTSGSYITGVGVLALKENTTGSYNTALGVEALQANTTASNNTAVGYQAGYSNTTGEYMVAVGAGALYTSNGVSNTGLGWGAGYSTTSGTNNLFSGTSAGYANTTGAYNVALGAASLRFNTTANYNTAVGYQAGYSGTTGGYGVYVGYRAGYASNAAYGNVCIGYQVGANVTGGGNTLVGGLGANGEDAAGAVLTSGTYNSFFGTSAGSAITTGSKNTILGRYNGNQGGLDIRTSNGNIVLSDGDGTPHWYYVLGTWNTSSGITFPATQSASSNPNTLDDYEEGTFTPTIATGSANVTYTQQSGNYTKVGRLVTFGISIVLNTVTSAGSGDFQIGGLPFASSSSDVNQTRLVIQTSSVNFDATAYQFYAYTPTTSSSVFRVLYSYDNGSWSVAQANNFVIAAGSILVITGFYYTDT